MEPKTIVDMNLIEKIDSITLTDRMKRWQAAVEKAPHRIFVDRQKYATESWLQTDGEDLQIRRSKLLKHVLENIEIKIHEFDTLAGRMTPGVLGTYTGIDLCGDYIDGIWSDDNKISITLHTDCALTDEDIEILRESSLIFRGKSCADMANKAWETVLGDWPFDIEKARLKDPPLNSGNYGNTTMCLNWKKIFDVGLRGIINEAQAHIDDFIENMRQDASKVYFWKSAIMVCEAAIAFAHRYAAQAWELAAAETNEERKAELLKMAELCEYVPENPARTFHDCLQCMAIIGIIKGIEHPMHNHPQWGRADQFLHPYLMNDLKNGDITIEKAADLLSELVGRWGKQILVDTGTHKETHQITFGINGVNICGITADGKEGTNEVSYMLLHVVGMLQQSSPTVVVRWNHFTPHWFMRKAIKTNLLTGGGIPLFENEEVIIDHFVADGVPLEEAREWIGLGCVWPVLPTRGEYKGGAAGFSAAAMLHLALHNGVAITGKKLGLETGDPRNFKTFDEVFEAFAAQFKFIMHRTLWLANLARDEQYKYLRLPFLTAMSLQFCMDKGHDTMAPDVISQFGITDRAIIDASDSLFAIKKLVFDDKKLTMTELMDALDDDFTGPRGPEIQKMCLDVPKYGNDYEEADQMARKVSLLSASTVKSWDNSPYPNFISVREGLSWHYAAGLGVGALPNGRKALEPLDDGSASPQRGCDKNGPTAVCRSVLNAGFHDHSYVQALNQKFPSNMLKTETDIDKMVAYTNSFLGAGGTNIMYNLVDTAEMKKAQEDPEEYTNLIVRVGGFSAYFVELSRQIQDDIILRSEHAL